MATQTAPAIERLWTGHWPEPRVRVPRPAAGARALVLETCQRQVVVTADPATARALTTLQPPEQYQGPAAYRFLLEVTTGLRSAVPGETNVFGQVRRAWEAYRRTADRGTLAMLGPLIASLTADTRAIRREHLQGIGGASYGALVRRLLRPADGERVLLVGAGELARSMLTFFRTTQLGVWSRRPAAPAFATAARLFAAEDGGQAADWAHHVIITTPADPANDRRWLQWLAGSLVISAVHLGRRRSECPAWPAQVRGYDLDDVFELRRTQDNVRSRQLQRALHACGERARRRAGECSPRGSRLAAG